MSRHRLWPEVWEGRHRLVAWALVSCWPFWMALPFAYLAAVEKGGIFNRSRGALALMLGVMAASMVGGLVVVLGACLLIEWSRCRRVRISDRGVCVRLATDWSGFVAYRKIERVEFGSVFVDDAAFPVLRVVDHKGRRRTVGLGSDVSEEELAAYLSERGVTVERCEDHQS